MPHTQYVCHIAAIQLPQKPRATRPTRVVSSRSRGHARCRALALHSIGYAVVMSGAAPPRGSVSGCATCCGKNCVSGRSQPGQRTVFSGAYSYSCCRIPTRGLYCSYVQYGPTGCPRNTVITAEPRTQVYASGAGTSRRLRARSRADVGRDGGVADDSAGTAVWVRSALFKYRYMLSRVFCGSYRQPSKADGLDRHSCACFSQHAQPKSVRLTAPAGAGTKFI